MYTQLALDLQLARRKAGLTQSEAAALLNISRRQLARLEKGNREPSLREIIALSLLYGRSFEGFFANLVEETKAALRGRICLIPPGPGPTADRANRERTLKRLKEATVPSEDGHAS